jgi:chromosome segregation ATPase
MSTKIERLSSQAHARELLENELEKNEAKIDILQCECNALWDELDVMHAKLRQAINKKNDVKLLNEKINKKIIKLKQINNNIV